MEKIPKKAIERLIVYRKILNQLKYDEVSNVFSHRLADLAGSTPAQVRRDLMLIGYNGSPAKGYEVGDLENSISKFLDNPLGQRIAIIGVGNLGSSLLDYCYWRYSNLSSIAAFEINPDKIGKEINGCHIYNIDQLKEVNSESGIDIAILAIPADDAQNIANMLVSYGIKGILNYSPARLVVPDDVYVEDLDMMLALERVAYFARSGGV